MTLDEAKQQFIQTWARLGAEWGINRTMAQVHALLLASDRALSTDEIMEMLSVSRGNANMNLRELVKWNLIYRETRPGDRKEYFRAEKNTWEMARRIARERKKREIEPMLRELSMVEKVDEQSAEAKQFTKTIKDIRSFATKVDHMAEAMLKTDETWVFNALKKLL